MLATAMVVGLSLAFAGSALAADAGCGQCHGAYINNTNGTKTLMPGVSTLEDTKTPQAGDICNDQGRGLHGVHMNYSSATYGKKGTTRGNCNYCHNEHIHENAYVEFEGYEPAEALGTIASSSSVTLNAGGTGYVVGDIATINGGTNGAVTVSAVSSGVVTAFTVSSYRESHGYSVANGIATTNVVGTGTGLTVNITTITNYGLRQTVDSKSLAVSGTGIGVNGLDIMLMNGQATCTGACHSGTSATNPAAWGNITSVGMSLSCISCHDDASNNGLGLSSPATYGHKIHLDPANGWLSDGTDKTMIVMGSYSGYLNAGDNSACQFCHPDNRNDLWSQGRADNATVKAYPHASDGTNVLSKNASFNANVVLANWTGTYMAPMCTTSCHVQQSSAQAGYAKWDGSKITPTGFSNCEICHQHKSSAAINSSSNVPLTYAHSIHFANLSTTAGRVACSVCHASVHTNYAGKLMITRLPVTPGTAGLLAEMNWSKDGTIAVDGTCQNSCHLNASPAWNSIATNDIVSLTGCSTCHSYPGVAGRDWTTSNSGHLARASVLQNATTAVVRKSIKHLNVATAYSATTDTYAGATGSVFMCGKCHAGATHMNGTVNVADSNSLGQCSTTSFTYNNISGAGSVNRKVNCSNVSCHFGKTTPNWF
jgi:hypothetical protein